MNLREAILEVYGSTDEQDDLNPYDAGGQFNLASSGAVRLAQALTRAAAMVATWKFPNGYRLHFRDLEAETIVRLRGLSGMVTGVDSVNERIELSGDVAALDLVGRRLELTDEAGVSFSSVITSQVGAFVGVLDDLMAAGLTLNLATTYRLTRAMWLWSAADLAITPEPVEVIGLYDMGAGAELEQGEPNERFAAERGTLGSPTVFIKVGKGFLLNTTVDDVTLRVRFVHYPIMGTVETDELCSLPEAFHEPVVQWARYWAFSRAGDYVAERKVWDHLEKLMFNLRSQFDLELDYASSRLEMK